MFVAFGIIIYLFARNGPVSPAPEEHKSTPSGRHARTTFGSRRSGCHSFMGRRVRLLSCGKTLMIGCLQLAVQVCVMIYLVQCSVQLYARAGAITSLPIFFQNIESNHALPDTTCLGVILTQIVSGTCADVQCC